MYIRLFSPLEDMNELEKIEKECFGSGFSNATFFHFQQISPNYFTLYQDSIISGYCLGSISSTEDNVGWIISIGVLPKKQSQTIGKQLLLDMISKLSSHVEYIRLTVSQKNERAYKFYLSHGFYVLQESYDIYSTNKKSYLLEYKIP